MAKSLAFSDPAQAFARPAYFLGALAPKRKLARPTLLLNKTKCKTEHWDTDGRGVSKCEGWECSGGTREASGKGGASLEAD